MRRIILKRISIVLLAAVLMSPSATLGQTRRRSTPRPKASSSTAQKSTEARTAGVTSVVDQIKFLTKVIYLLGGVSSGIAAVDEAAKRKEASPAVLQKNEQSKATVKTSIQGFRESLDKLEIDFRATPELQPYYIKMAGGASWAANTEQQTAAHQFDAAGRSLLNVVNRLTDVLLAMR